MLTSSIDTHYLHFQVSALPKTPIQIHSTLQYKSHNHFKFSTSFHVHGRKNYMM